MKKVFFFASVAMSAIFASCSSNTETIETPQSGNLVTVSFAADQTTRAFYGDLAVAEPWEAELHTVGVYVFDPSGNLILRRVFSPGEAAAKKVVFALPNSAKNTTCTFAVVANADAGSVASYAALRSTLDKASLDEYNGDAAMVMAGSKRPDGFVMTGESAATVGTATAVAVNLKRNVAKIAVRTSISDELAEKFNGAAVNITSARIENVNAASYLMGSEACPGAADYSYTQTSKLSATSDNLFYVYGTPAGSGQKLILSGIFDADGSTATKDDQTEMEYTVNLTGDGTGLIKRNGYYRIGATIKGLSGDAVQVSIEVSDWETPVTQEVELGS